MPARSCQTYVKDSFALLRISFCAAPNIILLLIFCDSYLIIIVRKFISKDDIDGYLYGDARSMFGKQSCV